RTTGRGASCAPPPGWRRWKQARRANGRTRWMQAFLAILRYDLSQLTQSWISRIWIPLLVAPALFLVIVAASEGELASETLAAYLVAVLMPLSAVAVAVLTAGSIAGEAQIIADGILSRSVTRTEFVSAKIVARL